MSRRVRLTLHQRFRRVVFRGAHECNICASKVRLASISNELGGILASYGFGHAIDHFETLNHEQYLCPVCDSTDRDRLYALYIDRYLGSDFLRKVLDFAPSRALTIFLEARVDLVHRTADLMMDGVDDMVDITNMPIYSDGLFDFVICSHVLEHVSDDRRALSELNRVLKPGGAGIVMVPICPEGSFDEDPTISDECERWRRFAQGDHVRLYDRSTFCSRIRQSGFDIEALDVEAFGEQRFRLHGIAQSSVLYIVKKPSVEIV